MRAVARSPMLRTNVPPMSLCCAPKTCSTRTRNRERLLLPPFSQSHNGRLRQALRWIRQTLFLDLLLNVFRPVGAVRPHTACRVVRCQQAINRLAVVNRRICHAVTTNQLVPAVDVEVVLVAIMTLAVLFRPPRIRVFLTTPGRLVRPVLGRLALLDPGVVSTAVACLGTATIDASMI